MDPFVPDDLPHRPAGEDFRPDRVREARRFLLLLRHVVEDRCVLLRGVVDPAGEHPVEYLVVTRAFDLRDPPETPLRYPAHDRLPVLAHRPVDDRLLERRRGTFQDLLHLLGEVLVVEDDHGPGLHVVLVEEELVRHRPFQFVPAPGPAGVSC